MNRRILEPFFNRMKNERFKESVCEIEYFKNLPNNLIRLLLGLDKESFNRYIIFIAKLNNKNLIVGSSDILISISQMLVIKMKSPNTEFLINLLVSTNILHNKNIVAFSSMLLQMEDLNKINALKTIFSRLKYLDVANIINYLGIINRCKNQMQLNLLVKLLSNNELRNHKHFNYLIEMFLRYPNNINLVVIEKCLHNNNLLENRNCLFILKKYLLNATDEKEVKFISEIITNPEMLNSRYLINVLDIVSSKENKNYYLVIQKLVNEKKFLTDSVFECLLNSIFKVKNKLQLQAILSLLNYPELLRDELQTAFMVEKYLLITKKYQFIALDRLLEKTSCLENFDLYKTNNIRIIQAIFETEEDYKAYCLANSSQDIIDYKYAGTIIKTISNTTNPLICRYITLLLAIENLKESDNFLKIFDSLLKCSDESQMAAIVTLSKQEKVIKFDNYLKIFEIINNCQKSQIIAIIKIIDSFENLNQIVLFKYLFNILSENNINKIEVLTEIIVNHQLLGEAKTFDYIALVKNKENDEYKKVLEDLKKEFQTLNIDTQINTKKRIFKLGRK